jgi:PAS domain S-box-containing protein
MVHGHDDDSGSTEMAFAFFEDPAIAKSTSQRPLSLVDAATTSAQAHIQQLQQSLAEAVQALHVKSSTLDTVLQQVSDQVVLVDADTGLIVEGPNHQGKHLWEIPQSPFSDYSQGFWKTHLSQAADGKDTIQEEWKISMKGIASTRNVVVVAKAVANCNNQGIEQALKESEERHRTLFECMVQGVVYQVQGGAIIAANPSAERVLGLSLDEMMGRLSVDPRWKATHEDGSDYPGETHPSMVALTTGKPVLGAVMGIYHPRDESTHWIVVDAMPRFRNNETQPYQVYSTFTDITERRRYEKEILKAKERAEEGDKLKSAFLANMSHEIRTPLNGILGHLELAIGSNLSEDSRNENLEGLEVAMRSGRLLVNIIEDILDLSKIEAGQLDVSKDQAFPLRQIIQQVNDIGNMLISQRQKTITLRTKVEPTIAKCIYGDFYRIQQVLNNLVSNAIKFTDAGFVEIRIGFQDGDPTSKTLLFEIQDTGKGISETNVSIVFQPFRQVDFGDTRKQGGTGKSGIRRGNSYYSWVIPTIPCLTLVSSCLLIRCRSGLDHLQETRSTHGR